MQTYLRIRANEEYKEYTKNIRGIYKENTRNIQGKYEEYTRNVREMCSPVLQSPTLLSCLKMSFLAALCSDFITSLCRLEICCDLNFI
jgi:hypothetical protein